MIVKVGNGYLELNELIEVEKKVKLFEDISTTEGDFSYSFSIPKTQNNISLIRIFTVNDSSKRWNTKIPADILSDSGDSIYTGFIRVENENKRFYSASFYSGNSNWIDSLDYNLLDIGWEDIVVPPIINSFTNTSGIVFPLLDNGALMERKSPQLSQDDFRGFIYAKDVVNRLLTVNGMKLEGNILNIPEYVNLITTSGNSKFLQDQIDRREVYVGKTVNQSITGSSSSNPTYYNVLFDNVSDPFYNSDFNNWNTVSSRYSFDVDVKEIEFEINLLLDNGSSGIGIRVSKNGGSIDNVIYSAIYQPNTKSIRLVLDQQDFGGDQPKPGDFYQVTAAVVSTRSILSGSYVRVTPKKFLQTFATDTIPDMTGKDFLANIFRMFNMIVSFNPKTQTITANTFDSVIRSVPVDLSEHIEIQENNFEEFISDYYQENLMVWSDQSNDFVDEFNDANVYPYGSGVINIENDFLENRGEFLEMDFAGVWQQAYGYFGVDLPYLDMLNYQVKETRDLANVSDDGSGNAVFNYSGITSGYYVVRVSESTIPDYNGEYYADLSSGTFNSGYRYLGTATGKVEILTFTDKSSDPIFLLNNPSQSVQNVMGIDAVYVIDNTAVTTIAIANFIGNDDYELSLDFDDLKGKYFSSTESVLNRSVKSFGSGNIPEKIYKDIDFMSTVKVNGDVYYPQVIRGYNGSKYPCEVELIKI